MKIGIDIDGVLYPWTDAANEAVIARFGVADPGPHRYWGWLKEQLAPDQWAWLWTDDGSYAAFSRMGLTYPGVVEAFLPLLKRHEVHFVTHRDPRRTAVLTSLFLQFHFHAHPWAGLHVVQNGTPKHRLADWDAFVDDKPETVENMLRHTGARVFAPVRPWNGELASNPYNGGRLIHYDDPAEVPACLGT